MNTYQKLAISLFFTLFYTHSYAQRFDPAKLESTVQAAVKKAYATSVRMWGFDVGRQMRTSAQFSGVVVSADGYILTAAHVNTPGNTYKVMFPDGTNFIARGLGEIELADNRSVPDVAMMKIIDKGNWPYAEMGWSSALKINEPCISIAYPESLDQAKPTVRFGRIADLNNKFGFIQSTCIMEPGDSGGPLFDYMGRVVGMHSAIDVSENDNFEIPVDLYRKYWTSLNTAETFKNYPATEDAVKSDPYTSKILTVPGLVNMEPSFKKMASKLPSSTYLIQSNLNDSAQTLQGTLISSTGLAFLNDSLKNGSILVSKSSMLGADAVVLFNNKKIDLTVLKRDVRNDLVLLYAPVKMEGGINLGQLTADSLSTNQLGKFLLSPLSDGSYRVSILGSNIFSLPKKTSMPYLGAEIGFVQGWVVLKAVNQNSPAGKAGLAAGDQLLEVNGKSIDRPEDFVKVIQELWPEDSLKLKLLRPFKDSIKDTTLFKEFILTAQPPTHFNHPAELFKGGKSIRRDGFSQVFAHDARLHPNECGGPVFDTKGLFYGINMARFSRTTSIVIPGSIISQLIEEAFKSH